MAGIRIQATYGQDNSILDNCHIRLTYTANDEKTAKRISDLIGQGTHTKLQRNAWRQPRTLARGGFPLSGRGPLTCLAGFGPGYVVGQVACTFSVAIAPADIASKFA